MRKLARIVKFSHSSYIPAMQTIRRKNYEAVLWQLKDKRLIKAVTGVRRCGKSTLLNLLDNAGWP